MIHAVRDYVSRMASDVSGMKVLVMDAETTGIVSMVYTQTQILQHEVFLIDSIENSRSDKMAHLKAIYFVRPTHENVRLLQEEFKDPKYGEYHIFFSNMARDTMIQQLAEADEHEVVQQVRDHRATRTEHKLALSIQLANCCNPAHVSRFSTTASSTTASPPPLLNFHALLRYLLSLSALHRYKNTSQTSSPSIPTSVRSASPPWPASTTARAGTSRHLIVRSRASARCCSRSRSGR